MTPQERSDLMVELEDVSMAMNAAAVLAGNDALPRDDKLCAVQLRERLQQRHKELWGKIIADNAFTEDGRRGIATKLLDEYANWKYRKEHSISEWYRNEAQEKMDQIKYTIFELMGVDS